MGCYSAFKGCWSTANAAHVSEGGRSGTRTSKNQRFLLIRAYAECLLCRPIPLNYPTQPPVTPPCRVSSTSKSGDLRCRHVSLHGINLLTLLCSYWIFYYFCIQMLGGVIRLLRLIRERIARITYFLLKKVLLKFYLSLSNLAVWMYQR